MFITNILKSSEYRKILWFNQKLEESLMNEHKEFLGSPNLTVEVEGINMNHISIHLDVAMIEIQN